MTKIEIQLDTILRILSNWIEWTKEIRKKEGLITHDDCFINFPQKPTIGVMKNWRQAIHNAKEIIEPN